MNAESARLESFGNWPKGFYIKPRDLAAAGYIYLNTGVTVMCVFCNMIVEEWRENQTPIRVHSTEKCPLFSTRNENIKNTDRLPGSKYPEMSHVLDRLATFTNISTRISVPIAECGLFMHDGKVLCFCCGKYANRQNPIERHDNCRHLRTLRLRRPLNRKDLEVWKTYAQQSRIKDLVPSDPICECTICVTWPALKVFVPCGHAVTCLACCYRFHKCPMCRQKIDQRISLKTCSPINTLINCVTCLKKPAKTMFVPCGHTVTCDECSPQFEKCIKCHLQIEKCIQIFLC